MTTADDPHICKPGATVYYCPTADDTESDCHGGFDVCCARIDLHQQILRCSLAHCRQAHGPHSWEPQPGMAPVRCEGFDAPAVNPPGSTREQLPDNILALLVPRTYLSTACETARLLDGAIIRNPDRGDLPELRDRMHGRCRRNHKFTGVLCNCPCHPGDN